jgi:hypothetical protein
MGYLEYINRVINHLENNKLYSIQKMKTPGILIILFTMQKK